MRWIAAVAAAALGIAELAPAALSPHEAPLTITGCGLERMRKSRTGATNKVTSSMTLEAREGADIRGLVARVDYVDYMGKVLAKGGKASITNLPAGEKRRISVSAVWVPIFNGYVVTVTGTLNGKRGEWRFYGAPGALEPFFIPPKPIPRLCAPVVMSNELEQKSRSPGANLYVRVRNLGAVGARNARATVQLMDKNGRKKGRPVSAKLSGARGGRAGIIGPGEERLFVMRFRRFPEYEGYSVSLAWDEPPAEERLAGGEFAGAKDVELAHFAFENEQGDLVITGDARNGLDEPVENVKVIVRLLGAPKKGSSRAPVLKTARTVLRGRLAPGKTRQFRVLAKGVKAYDNFDYEVAYDEMGERARSTPLAAGNAVVQVKNAVKKPDGTVVVTGEIRNAGGVSIRDVEIVFSFKKTEGGSDRVVRKVRHTAEGTLRPRERAEFRIAAENVPPFDEYFYEVSYKPVP